MKFFVYDKDSEDLLMLEIPDETILDAAKQIEQRKDGKGKLTFSEIMSFADTKPVSKEELENATKKNR